MYTVDASVWVNGFDQREAGHEMSRQLLELLRTQALPLIEPTLVLAEGAGAISRTRQDCHLTRLWASGLLRWPPSMAYAVLMRCLRRWRSTPEDDRMPKRLSPLHLLILLLLAAPAAAQPLADVVRQAEALGPLETLIVARAGEILVEEGFRGHATTAPTNVKSVAKTIISALVGIAIDRGLLEGPDQKVAPLLRDKLPADPDPRLHGITIGNLLSMQAGLQRTSGPNYGRWVASRDWVRAALDQPFVGEPGGGMLYSTGNSHLLSAILTRVGGRSTLALAHDWLAPLEEFAIADWMRDPQGIYFGGNQMAMTPRALLAFGELYRNSGRAGGRQVLSPGWIETSWQPRTQSVFHDDLYGYGWFLTRMGGHAVAYAWGYGGQMVYVVPGLGLTVVMTSAADRPSARNGHRDDLHTLMRSIVAAVKETT